MKQNSKATAVATEATSGAPINKEVGIRYTSELVIREDGIIPFGEGGISLGQMLDGQLSGLAKDNGEPRTISYSFDAESWEKAKEFYKNFIPPERDRWA